MYPLVSVIVPAYNASGFLAHTLDSALAQTLHDFELIVVNDGSSDDTGVIAERYALAYPKKFSVIHQENSGLCVARNVAIQRSRGKYLALLDADDVWYSHHLAASIKLLESDELIGMVHADVNRTDVQGKFIERAPRRWHLHADQPWTAIYLRREHVLCPTAVFRRSTMDQVGNFDMNFNRLGCEDRDLWLRLAAVSRVVYQDDVQAEYRIHATSMSKAREKMFKARSCLIEKHSQTESGRLLHLHALAALHLDTAHEMRGVGEKWRALAQYFMAWQYNMRQIDPIKGVIKTLVGHKS